MTDDVIAEAKEKMQRAVEHAKAEFGSIRTGRASSALVERLRVDYYGSDVPLQQIAGFASPEPHLLVITPYDRGSLKAVEKAIEESDLGITPSNDGSVVRLSFPSPTAERRKELVKTVKKKAEEGKVAVRNVRKHARQTVAAAEKSGDLPAGDVERLHKQIDQLTHEFEAEVDRLVTHKEQELLEV